MANPSTPSRASRNTPQRKVHRYIDALVSDDFGRLSKLTTHSANTFSRKKLDTASQSLQLKVERQGNTARRIEIREWRAAERSVAAELRESDHRIRLMWRCLNTKIRPDKKLRHTPPNKRKRDWPYAAVALPKYDGPVIDRRGQRGVFARFRYYSRKTAKAGVSQRVVAYCFHGAELDPDGNPYVATNVGDTIDEAMCGFDHLEQINWSSQSNAKLLMHGIFAVDYRQSPDEMMTVGVRWAEEAIGRFDLPYLVTLHAPPPDGDQRNWHLHVLWSYRPLVRTGDHEWQVGEMLRTDLDNSTGMKLLRETFATVMTEMAFEAGQNQVYTAKSNADRGLVHEPQVHLGGAKTNRARSGECVAENEENHERVMRSKAAVIDESLRHADEALARQQDIVRAAASRWARLPTLPMRLPERIAAATMAMDAPAFRAPPALSAMSIIAPVLPMAAPPAATRIGAIGSHVPTRLPRAATIDIPPVAPPRSLAQSPPIRIANLRIQPLPLARQAIMLPPALPTASARSASISLPGGQSVAIPPLARFDDVIAKPVTALRPSLLRLPHYPPVQPPMLADIDIIDRAISRIAQSTQLDDERRKRERERANGELAERRAKAVATQREQADRALLAAGEADKPAPKRSAWHGYRVRRQQFMSGWGEIDDQHAEQLERRDRSTARPGSASVAERARDIPRFQGFKPPGIGD